MSAEIYGLIMKDEEGYSLWTEHGMPVDVQEVILSLMEPYINEGGSTSPCETVGELLHETCVKVNLQPLYAIGGNYFMFYGGKIIRSVVDGNNTYKLYKDKDDCDLMKYDGSIQIPSDDILLLTDGEEVIVLSKTSECVTVMSVKTGRKVYFTPEEFNYIVSGMEA